jgi:ATP-dependent Clp protease ATP-binding subunit ClpA
MVRKRITPLHSIILSAKEEACAEGSRTIEAEHILLALSSQKGSKAQEILESSGLDHEAIRDALNCEFEKSLLAVGIQLEDSEFTSRSRNPDFQPRFAQSAKLAVHRAAALESKRIAPHLEPIHLLFGVLDAKDGTVPRILEIVGVDLGELRKRVEEALSLIRKH